MNTPTDDLKVGKWTCNKQLNSYGQWVFYLAVKDNIPSSQIEEGWDAWSDVGTHKVKGRYDMWWYFRKITVNVIDKPPIIPTAGDFKIIDSKNTDSTDKMVSTDIGSLPYNQSYTTKLEYLGDTTGYQKIEFQNVQTLQKTVVYPSNKSATVILKGSSLGTTNTFDCYITFQGVSYFAKRHYITYKETKSTTQPPSSSPTPQNTTTPPPSTPTPTSNPSGTVIADLQIPATVLQGQPAFIDGSHSSCSDAPLTFKWTIQEIIDPLWQSTITTNGNAIWNLPGLKQVTLLVTTPDGRSAFVVKTINVISLYPTAAFEVTGNLKENRLVKVNSYSSGGGFPLTDTMWTFIAMSPNADVTSIKYNGATLNNQTTFNTIIKKPGIYRVNILVRNQGGYEDSTFKIITIVPDVSPIADMYAPPKVIRDPSNENKVKFGITELSTSPDYDSIGTWNYEFRYDSNNNSSFDDEEWLPITDVIRFEEEIIIPPMVGKMQLKLTAVETFTDTLTQFMNLLDPSDYKRDYITKIVEVNNIAPVSSFSILTKRKIDLIINNATNLPQIDLQTNVTDYLESELKTSNIDLNIVYLDGLNKNLNTIILGLILRENSERYFIDFNNTKRPELAQNVDLITILNNLQENDISYVGLGNSATNLEMSSLITNNSSNGIYVDNSALDVAFNKIANYVLNKVVTDVNINVGLTTTDISTLKNKINSQLLPKLISKNINAKVTVNKGYSYAKDVPNDRILVDVIGDVNVSGSSSGTPREHADASLNISISKLKVVKEYDGKYYLTAESIYKAANIDVEPRPSNGYGYFELKDVYIQIRAYFKMSPISNEISFGTFYEGSYHISNKSNSFPLGNARLSDLITTNLPKLNIGTSKPYSVRIAYSYQHYAWNHFDGIHFGYQTAELPYSEKVIKDRYTSDNLNTTTLNIAYRPVANKFLVDIEDNARAELNDLAQSTQFTDYLKTDSKYFVGLGTGSNQYQYNNIITSNDDKGTFINNSNIDTAIDNLADYIIEKSIKTSPVIKQYILINQPVCYTKLFADYETDSLNNEKWKFIQNKTYFENNNGDIIDNLGIYSGTLNKPLSGQEINYPIQEFAKIGEYTINYSVQDNPLNDPNFDNYKKWSTPSTIKLYVHRRPIAQFNFTANINIATNLYTPIITDTSYDLDHTIRTDKGIKNRIWKWKDATSLDWNNGLPATLNKNNNYTFSLEVEDLEDCWSVPVIRTFSTFNVPPTIDANPQTATSNADIQITITADDKGENDFSRMRYVITNSVTYPTTGWTEVYTKTQDITLSDEGTWYLHMEVFDTLNQGFYIYRGAYIINKYKLYNFGVTSVSDKFWSEGIFIKKKVPINREFFVNELPLDHKPISVYSNYIAKKGYYFNYDLMSNGLNGDADKIEIIPTYYYISNMTDEGIKNKYEIDLYYNYGKYYLVKVGDPVRDIFKFNYNNVELGGLSKLILTKDSRTIIDPVAGTAKWSGTLGLPTSLIAVKKDVPIVKDRTVDESVFLKKGYVLVNFGIKGYKDNVEVYNYLTSQWSVENGPKNTNLYNVGDVMVFDNSYSAIDDYTISTDR